MPDLIARNVVPNICWLFASVQTRAFVVGIALLLTSCAKPGVVSKIAIVEDQAGLRQQTGRAPLIIYTNDTQTITPFTYTNRNSGVIYRVESDGRHVSASTDDRKLLWRRNPFVDAQMEPYRYTKPVIIMIGTARDLGYTGNPDEMWVKFSSSQVGKLDPATGDFRFVMQD